jgi:hypothetical protein
LILGSSVSEVAQLSLASLSGIRGRRMVLYRNGEEQQPLMGWGSVSAAESSGGSSCVPIPTEGSVKPVSSIDSSVIVLGEVDDGFVMAGKVTVSSRREGKKYAYVFGPSIFYIGESNVAKVNELLSNRLPERFIIHDAAVATRVVRVIMERAAALDVAINMSGGILALDGSLRVSNFEPSRCSLVRIAETCERNGVVLMGVTKNTKLRPLQRLEGKLYKSTRPSFMEVSDVVRSIAPTVLGRSVLARLSSDGVPLRIDILTEEGLEGSLSSLVASDILCHGYPDTLKAAHILSIFSLGEEESAKGRLVRTEGTNVVQSFNVRRALLGKMQLGGRGGN